MLSIGGKAISLDWGNDLAKLTILGYWGDEIGSYGEFSTFMKYIGGTHSPIPSEFAPMLTEFPKNFGKSRDKSYPTDQKTSSILVPTVPVPLQKAKLHRST